MQPWDPPAVRPLVPPLFTSFLGPVAAPLDLVAESRNGCGRRGGIVSDLGQYPRKRTAMCADAVTFDS